jgi:outer membrane lipoprotein
MTVHNFGLINLKGCRLLTVIVLFLIYILFYLAGCVPVISKQLREQVAKGLTLEAVAKDPETYKGKTVLWSGVIISSKSLKEGTMIEVLQKSADTEGKPMDVDKSEGRFLALHSGYLDSAIYSGGRKITVAGVIQGKKIQCLGEIDYVYPLISTKEIHLWPAEKEDRFYLYPYRHYPWWRYPYPYWW